MASDDPLGEGTSVLRRERTLAVVLGSSEWPRYPEFTRAELFRRSAHEIADYLCSPDGLNLPKANIRVRIDDFEDAAEILRGVRRFVRERRDYLKAYGTPVTDLLIYYVGHGGFGERDAFFLSVRATDEDDPLATSITAESLGRLIREDGAGLRTYLVLDCCFAASVMKVFMSGGGPLGVAEVKVQDALPPQGDPAGETGAVPEYGAALLCASGPREPARAPPDLPYTMFTGGLLEVLREGDAEAPLWLSIADLQRSVRAKLTARFRDKAVLPQVHAPVQRRGRVDLVPLFRNPARARRVGPDLAAPPAETPLIPEQQVITRGFFIMTACSNVEVSKVEVMPDKVISAFTAALVTGIERGVADHNRKGKILLSDLQLFVAHTVKDQSPQFFASYKASGDPLISFNSAALRRGARADSGKRLAMLIGNQIFPESRYLAQLRNPANDVAALARVLGDPERGSFEVHQLLDKTRSEILSEINQSFSDAAENDFLLIYYSGHGILDRRAQLCLATKDTSAVALFSTSIPARHLRELINDSHCGQVLLLLDCDYSGSVGGEI